MDGDTPKPSATVGEAWATSQVPGKRRFRHRSRLFTFGRVQDCFAKFPHKIVAGSARVAAGSARALAQSVKLHGDIADVSFSRPNSSESTNICGLGQRAARALGAGCDSQ